MPGWVGADCGGRDCPNNCSHQGSCLKGICVCKSLYGGEDCSLNRLELSKDSLLNALDFDLKLGDKCHFLSKSEADRGGWNIIYAGEKNKIYHVNQDMRALLPEVCPESR